MTFVIFFESPAHTQWLFVNFENFANRQFAHMIFVILRLASQPRLRPCLRERSAP